MQNYRYIATGARFVWKEISWFKAAYFHILSPHRGIISDIIKLTCIPQVKSGKSVYCVKLQFNGFGYSRAPHFWPFWDQAEVANKVRIIRGAQKNPF